MRRVGGDEEGLALLAGAGAEAVNQNQHADGLVVAQARVDVAGHEVGQRRNLHGRLVVERGEGLGLGAGLVARGGEFFHHDSGHVGLLEAHRADLVSVGGLGLFLLVAGPQKGVIHFN